MSKETTAVKFAENVLSNKAKFKRFIIILIIILTACVIALGIGFYTGAVTYHKESAKKIHAND